MKMKPISVIIILVSALFGNPVQNDPNSIKADSVSSKSKSKNYANEQIRISFDTAFLFNEIESLRTEVKRFREAYSQVENKKDEKYDFVHFLNSIGIDDIGMFILTLCLVVGVWRQLNWSRKTIQEMQKDRRAREDSEKFNLRAKIRIVEGRDISVSKNSEGNTIVIIFPKAINIGKTAAINVEFFCTLEMVIVSPEKKVRNLRGNYHHSIMSKEYIPEGGSKDFFSNDRGDPIARIILAPDKIQDIEAGNENGRLFFFGYLRFDDVFGRSWSQEFTWEVLWPTTTPKIMLTGYGRNEEVDITNWKPENLVNNNPKNLAI